MDGAEGVVPGCKKQDLALSEGYHQEVHMGAGGGNLSCFDDLWGKKQGTIQLGDSTEGVLFSIGPSGTERLKLWLSEEEDEERLDESIW